MKKVAFVIYREWAYRIFEQVLMHWEDDTEINIALLVTTPQHEFALPRDFSGTTVLLDGNNQTQLLDALHDIDVAFFFGWSWMVQSEVLVNTECLCLHPSPLPKYRGGSPIQHQIISGETDSAVTIFKMTEGIDDGDVYGQEPISLEGSLVEIFSRITEAGTLLTNKFIVDYKNSVVQYKKQEHLDKNPPQKRRTPADSIFTIDAVSGMTYYEVHNLVRALASPYPNLQIVFKNGNLYVTDIKKVLADESECVDDIFVNEKKPVTLCLKDAVVEVTEYSFEEK